MRHRRLFRLSSLPLLWCVAASSAHAELRVPDDYDTIQDAIDAIAANPLLDNSILIAAGTYEEELTLIDNLTLRGEETARVLLRATDGTDTVITGERVSNVLIRNLTFIGGDTGIALTNASNISILNNAFNLGDDQTAIDLPDNSTVDVVHNTFYKTGTAVRRVGSFAVIENNIFSDNQFAIETANPENIDYNLFYNNGGTDVFGDHGIRDVDPKFANVVARDFHLKQDSPAIDEGKLTDIDVIDSTRADLGAYGGAYAEAKPFPPQTVVATDVSADAGVSAIDITWATNASYLVTHDDTPGGYRVYYDSDASGEPYESHDAAEGDSPIDVGFDVGDTQTARLTGLAAANVTPDAPVISAVQPGPQRLTISWGAVTNATQYKLYYGTASVSDNTPLNVGNVTSYTLEGLTDGVSYQVAVTALNQPTYYIAVTAYDSFPEAERHESEYSTEQVVTLGTPNESAQSATGSGIPEIPVAYPNLPNEGCFIATAAYGYYDASEVRILRRFRDHFLLTHDSGRKFVAWYYAHSPRAADVIRGNASLRTAARIALLPVIGLTRIATAPHPLMHALPLFAFLLVALIFLRARRLSS